jgi:hypothetical protein
MQHKTLRSALAKMQVLGHVDAVDQARARGGLHETGRVPDDPAQLIRRFA